MQTTDRPGLPPILTKLAIWVMLFALLFCIHLASDIVGPLLVALNLLITAWPVRDAAIKHGWNPLLATAALGLVMFAVLGLAVLTLVLSITAMARELPQYQAQFTTMYNQVLAFAANYGVTTDTILSQLQQISPASIASFLSSAVSGVSGVVTTITVIIIMLFLMLLDAGTTEPRAKAIARYQPDLALAIGDFTVGVRRYWVVTSVFGLIVAALDTIMLVVMGVPLALVWGVVSFLTNYIPNVGFLIGVIPPATMALLHSGPTSMLIVVVAYIGINFVIQSVIQPKFNGDAVGVTALMSFVSLLVWSAALGPLGALLALPATLLLKALLVDHDPKVRWFNAFLASDPAMADPEGATRADSPEKVFVPKNGPQQRSRGQASRTRGNNRTRKRNGEVDK